MIYLTLFLCLTCITQMIETRNIYIINSTPRVSSDATVITCLDVDGDLLPSDLTLGRVGKGFNGERNIPQSPVPDIDSNSIVATWDETSGSSRYGAFYCSGSDGNGTVTTLKMAHDAELNPSADTMTVSIGDQVVIEMTFGRDFGEVSWKKDGVALPKDMTSTRASTMIYTIMSASTSDAGIYYAHFDRQPVGGFTRVIVRECPAGLWGPPDCSESCLDCMHGGKCDTITGMCICPPGFMGNLCEKACGSNVYGPECNHSCQADSCRSMQFCLPDPYGCSCATGWAGSTCEVECPDGLYGANCNESCECQNGGSCERHVGCICPDEWTGIHCHRPKFFFNSTTTRVTLADATQITVDCGCAPEVEDCPLQDIQIEITNPDPVPPNINRIIDDSDQSSIRWHLTPFGIAGNWDFTCSIDYRGNTYTHNLTVTAIGGPFPEIKTFHNVEANRDTTSSMECRVATMAGVEMDVKLRNEQGDLISHSRHAPGSRSSYYLFHIDALDENEGVYTCVATSQSGQTERDAIFKVLDPPVPEKAPSLITNSNGVVNLQLNARPFNGDEPLEEIFVEYKLSTSRTWSTTRSLSPSTTTYLLENLNGETQYEVRVVLVRPGERDEGRGEPGPIFTFQTLCSAPSRAVDLQDVSTDGLDSTSLRLEWQNPVGQDFDRINIYYRTVDQFVFEDVEVNDVSATSYVLRGLRQYQIYNVQVKLMNCGYEGPASNTKQRRTKEGAPGPVRELNVHPVSNAAVSITWQRPQNENGQIRYYNISAARAQPGTSLSDVVVERADPNEISYIMNNLQAATDYVISIRAVTILTGPVVTQEVTTKEWVPDEAPTNIRIESSETTLTFTFDEIIESERNGVIEMYEAKLQDATVTSSAVPPITQNFTQESVTFDKLTPGKQYIFNVRGWTAVGPGVWSADAINSTMPGGNDGTPGGSPNIDRQDGGNESSTGNDTSIGLLVAIVVAACVITLLVISVCAYAVLSKKMRSHTLEVEMNNAEEPVIRMSELITQQSLPNEYDNTAAIGYLSRPTSPVLSNQELNYWKIPWEAMFLERNIIAEGNFGQVLKATIKRDGEAIEAAVKILKGGCSDADRKDFIGEVEIMCKVGNHPNIVNLIGACESKGELFVALEFAVHGNLLTLLRKSQCLDVDSTYTNQSLAKMEAEPLSNIQLVNFARDVSLGMKHLSDRSIVHRDLAARNILVCDNMVCKVADFGLSRSDEVYVKMTAGRLPVRWMAIESLNYSVYTSKSDVWSFGILLWEIVTYGGTPYPGLSSAELYEKLPLGYRMDKPLGCDDEMYNIMRHCWRDRPHDRPTFEQLFIALSKLAKSDQNYENQSGVKGAEGGATPNFSTTTEFKFPSISSDEDIKPGASAV